MDPKPELQDFPSLRHLHLVACSPYLPAFSGKVPGLTHLRLSGSLAPDLRFVRIVCGAISSSPTGTEHPVESRLLSHVRQVIIEPSVRSTGHSQNMAASAAINLLKNADEHNKLVVLKTPSRGEEYGWAQAKNDWADRVNGGEGCWKARYPRVALYNHRASGTPA